MDSIIAFVAEYLYIVVVGFVLLYLVVFHHARLIELGIALVCIGGIGYLLSKILTGLVNSPRPFVVSGQAPLIHSATDNGFPSDHTLLVATLAAIVTLADRRAGAVVWLLALVIGLARVYAGVHHLLDVAGSFAIVLVATFIYYIGRRIWEQYLSSSTKIRLKGANK